MSWWTRLTTRHESWLRAFWKARSSPGRWVGLADALYKLVWLALLVALARRSLPESLGASAVLLLLHPVLPWRWKILALVGAGGLYVLHPLAALGWVLLALVTTEVLLYQTYEMVLFVPLWFLWSGADFAGHPMADRLYWLPWAVLAYGWAQKLAEPPLFLLLEDPDFRSWLEQPEEEGS